MVEDGEGWLMVDGGWWMVGGSASCTLQEEEDIDAVQEGGREWEGCGRQPMAEVASSGLASRLALSAAFTATERKETEPEPEPETVTVTVTVTVTKTKPEIKRQRASEFNTAGGIMGAFQFVNVSTRKDWYKVLIGTQRHD